MTEPNVRERVNIVIVSIFAGSFPEADGVVKITAETEIGLLCPDVLDLLFLAQEIQKDLDIEIPNDVPSQWVTVGDIFEYVEKLLSSSGQP